MPKLSLLSVIWPPSCLPPMLFVEVSSLWLFFLLGTISWEISSSEDAAPYDEEEDELLHHRVLFWWWVGISVTVPIEDTVLQVLVLEEMTSQFWEEATELCKLLGFWWCWGAFPGCGFVNWLSRERRDRFYLKFYYYSWLNFDESCIPKKNPSCSCRTWFEFLLSEM